MKRLLVTLAIMTVFLFLAAGSTSEKESGPPGFRTGTYGRVDGSRNSLVRFGADEKVYMELNTNFGYLEKTGTWSVNGQSVLVNWSSIVSPNNSVARGEVAQIPRSTTFEFGRDSDGDPYVEIGSTRYYGKRSETQKWPARK